MNTRLKKATARANSMSYLMPSRMFAGQVLAKTRCTKFVWGAVRKNIISDRFSTKTAISAHI